jgi:L-iditol 2-dehydrogenase
MTAAVLYGREDVKVEQLPIPETGPGEVRVKVRAALTCGTDLKVYRRGYHARMIVPPAVFGHEFAGEIDAVGEGVEGWTPGERVVAANSAACDVCFYCMRGRPELCEDLLFVNGAYAEYITLPQRLVQKNLLRMPEGLAYEDAALVEPLACVVRGMEEADVQPGETVAVLGAGQIGLMFIRLCKLAGARVIAVAKRPDRLKTAEMLGADQVIAAQACDNVVTAVSSAANGGRGPDRVIECVGLPEVWEQAIEMVRKAGLVSLFGGCPKESTVRLNADRIHYDEITLLGTFHHTPATVRTALELISDGRLPAAPFIGERAPLAELPRVFADLAQSTGSAVVKVAIHPGS